MNSTQALDYAIRIVSGHRVTSDAAIQFKVDALDTLNALRDMIADQQETALRTAQREIEDSADVTGVLDALAKFERASCHYCKHGAHVGRCPARMPYQGSLERGTRGTACGCPSSE